MSDATAVQRFLVEELGLDVDGGSLDPGRDLIASDLLDSMGITQTVAFIEERFGVEVADEDLVADNFRSVEAIADFIGRKGG